jgi:hypothetical protein
MIRSLINREFRCSVRRFSSVVPPKPVSFEKTGSFFYEHRQAIINTIGVAFVVYYAIHNKRVADAWDEREREFKSVQDELTELKTKLADEAWLSEAEAKVKAGGSLKDELKRNLKVVDQTSALDEKFILDALQGSGTVPPGKGML